MRLAIDATATYVYSLALGQELDVARSKGVGVPQSPDLPAKFVALTCNPLNKVSVHK